MKNCSYALVFLMLFGISYGFDELITTPESIGSVVEFREVEDVPLINTQGMKKDKQIQAEKEKLQKEAPRRQIQINTRELNHQRALDYMTKQSLSF